MYNMKPIKTHRSNFVFTAPTEMDDCDDLHVFKSDTQIESTWVFGSVWQRLKFLFTGELTLIIHGSAMPPVALVVISE